MNVHNLRSKHLGLSDVQPCFQSTERKKKTRMISTDKSGAKVSADVFKLQVTYQSLD